MASLINQSSSAVVEQVGNRLLALDPESSDKLQSFADKIIHVHITDLALNYYFLFPGASLVVQSHSKRQPSASISGKLSAFIASAASENSGDAVFSGELHFSGEINTARQFQSLAQSMQIDWQEPLSRVVGDVASHTITRGFSHIGELAKNWIGNLRQDLPEYLQEEVRVTPPALEVESFYEEVDLLRSQTDRLQARVQRLTQND